MLDSCLFRKNISKATFGFRKKQETFSWIVLTIFCVAKMPSLLTQKRRLVRLSQMGNRQLCHPTFRSNGLDDECIYLKTGCFRDLVVNPARRIKREILRIAQYVCINIIYIDVYEWYKYLNYFHKKYIWYGFGNIKV